MLREPKMMHRTRRATAWSFAVVLGAIACRGTTTQDEDPKTAAATEDGKAGAPEERPAPDLSQHTYPLLIWSAYEVETDYFDPSRIDPRGQLLAAADALGEHTPEFFADVQDDSLRVRVRSVTQSFALGDVTTLGGAAIRLEEILEHTQTVLDLEPQALHELEYAAINGLFAPLDPHTILLTPEQHADLGVRTKGEFGGVGAEIRPEARRIMIVSVLPGMPAEKAGVLARDVILTIDGESTVNMSAEEAQQKLRGPVGTKVVLTLDRAGKNVRVEVERQTIRIESVRAVQLPGDVAYLAIASFQEQTAVEARNAIAKLAKPTAIVMDLRQNTGGVLPQAGELIDAFVTKGELVAVRSAAGQEVAEAEDEVAVPVDVPMVVLLDEESASAAEIVGGGLQALGRAAVVGRTTFGKGTVQMVRAAAPYGQELALKLTVAEWMVAGGRKVQSTGVVPDIVLTPVEMSGIPGVARYFDEERFEGARERSRVAHLPSAKHEPSAKQIAALPKGPEVHYLATRAIPASTTAGVTTPIPEALGDPEVRIAFEIARAMATKPEADARKQAMLDTASRIRVEEDARIGKALGEQSVDWSPAPAAAAAPVLEATARIAGAQPVVAGSPFALEITVTNKGTTDAHRVWTITDCVHDELDGIEVLVGKVAAGKTETRTVKLHVMPWHADFTDTLDVAVHAGPPEETPDARGSARFEIVGTARPTLSYSYWIIDDPALAAVAPPRPIPEGGGKPTPLAITGNGDGVLQPGEKVLLAFEAHNDGPGASPDARVLLRNLSGRQGLLEEGFYALGVLAPGASRTGAFGLTMRDEADPAVPLELELVLGDAKLRTSTQDRLSFRVLTETPARAPVRKRVQVGGTDARLYAGAHPSSTVVATATAGVQLDVIGEQGGYLVVEGAGNGRRMFLPADLDGLAPAGARNTKLRAAPRIQVLPPTVDLDAVPRTTSSPTAKIAGTVRHVERARDVAVLVRPPGTGRTDRKVFYLANDATDAAGARSLAFAADVPLEPGGNRISILARDGAKIVHRRDLWIFRD
jgi:carboxyl-terminal processing protease